MEARTSLKILALVAALTGLPTIASAQGLQVFVFGDAGVVAQGGKVMTIAGSGATAVTAPGTSLSLNSGPWHRTRRWS